MIHPNCGPVAVNKTVRRYDVAGSPKVPVSLLFASKSSQSNQKVAYIQGCLTFSPAWETVKSSESTQLPKFSHFLRKPKSNRIIQEIQTLLADHHCFKRTRSKNPTGLPSGSLGFLLRNRLLTILAWPPLRGLNIVASGCSND